jgi:hypothetical protein
VCTRTGRSFFSRLFSDFALKKLHLVPEGKALALNGGHVWYNLQKETTYVMKTASSFSEPGDN